MIRFRLRLVQLAPQVVSTLSRVILTHDWCASVEHHQASATRKSHSAIPYSRCMAVFALFLLLLTMAFVALVRREHVVICHSDAWLVCVSRALSSVGYSHKPLLHSMVTSRGGVCALSREHDATCHSNTWLVRVSQNHWLHELCTSLFYLLAATRYVYDCWVCLQC